MLFYFSESWKRGARKEGSRRSREAESRDGRETAEGRGRKSWKKKGENQQTFIFSSLLTKNIFSAVGQMGRYVKQIFILN